MAMKTAIVTAIITALTPTPTRHIKDSDKDDMPGMPSSGGGGGNVAGEGCENIHSWISLSGDLVFSHQQGIYGFKFPNFFLEISSRDLTLFSILII